MYIEINFLNKFLKSIYMTYTIEKKRPKKKDTEKMRIDKIKQDPMYAVFGDYTKYLQNEERIN